MGSNNNQTILAEQELISEGDIKMAEVWARLGLGEFSASGLHSKPRACRVPTPHGCTTHIKVSTSDVPWSRAVLSLPECTQQPWIFLELQVSQTDTGRERERIFWPAALELAAKVPHFKLYYFLFRILL